MARYKIKVYNKKDQYTLHIIEDHDIHLFAELFSTFKKDTKFEIYRNNERDEPWEQIVREMVQNKGK